MKMKNFKELKFSAKKGWNKHGQLILAVVASGTAIAAVVAAFKGGAKAATVKEERREKIDEATQALQSGEISQKDFEEKAKVANIEAAKGFLVCYGPAVAFVTVSVVSTAFGYKISVGKQAAALIAYKALETKHEELVAKTKEIVGDSKFEKIKTEILGDHVNGRDIPGDVHAPEYEKDADGNYVAKQYMLPFMLDWDGSFFMGTRPMVDRALNKFAARTRRDMSGSWNDLKRCLMDEGCTGIGLSPHPNGDKTGWLPDDLDGQAILNYDIQPIMSEQLETPVQVIEFHDDPKEFTWD